MAMRVTALLFSTLFVSALGQDLFLSKAPLRAARQAQVTNKFASWKFEPSCESDDDFGYPRFNSMDELKTSPWANHISKVYGELPTSGYPICMFDFWFLPNSTDLNALGLKPIEDKAGGKVHGWHLPTFIQNIVSQFAPGIAYPYKKGEYVNGDLYSLMGGTTIYRDWYLFHQLPSNAWVEVTHLSSAYFSHETDAMWFTRSRGSGIWFNVGKTIAFDSHQDGFTKMFNGTGECVQPPMPHTIDPLAMGAASENALSRCIRSQGYDSAQMRPNPYPVMNTFGQAGWAELFSSRYVGKYACGTPNGGPSPFLKSGWQASRACDCDPSQLQTNCRT